MVAEQTLIGCISQGGNLFIVYILISNRKNEWVNFDDGLIAVCFEDAKFFKNWLVKIVLQKSFTAYFEEFDLHKRNISAVGARLKFGFQTILTKPSVFFVCKN